MRIVRQSQAFIPTLKEAPADAQVASHKLLVRAGFIRQLGAGIYDYLPLAKRSLAKIEAIVREEMDAIGGQEFFLPPLHPAEIWKESGRWEVTATKHIESFACRDLIGRPRQGVASRCAARACYQLTATQDAHQLGDVLG